MGAIFKLSTTYPWLVELDFEIHSFPDKAEMALEYIRTNVNKAVHESKPSFVDYFPHYKLQIFLLCVVVIIVAAYFWR